MPEKYYTVADCEHEVYEGEPLFEWEGKSICPDCMESKFNDLSVFEKAALLGCHWETVGKMHKCSDLWAG